MNQLVVLTLVRHCVEDIKEELLAEQLHPVLPGHLREESRIIINIKARRDNVLLWRNASRSG